MFLYKLVSNCFSCFSFFQIRNLNFCQCKICSDCLKQNFEVVIREKHVRHWTCPLCSKPDLNDEELGSEYINFLGMLVSAVCICCFPPNPLDFCYPWKTHQNGRLASLKTDATFLTQGKPEKDCAYLPCDS